MAQPAEVRKRKARLSKKRLRRREKGYVKGKTFAYPGSKEQPIQRTGHLFIPFRSPSKKGKQSRQEAGI